MATNPLIEALLKPEAYPHPVDSVKLIETHISWVLLTGQFAYKIKKPVNFGFLDFSTLDKRQFFCTEEIRLNRRLAEAWYLGVVPITGRIEQAKMDREGQAIEYAVKMRQFPDVMTLSQAAEVDQLEVNEVDQISGMVADFHRKIDKAGLDTVYGDSHEVKRWFDGNFEHIKPLLNNKLQLQQLEAIASWGRQEWFKFSALMDNRKREGKVRECHGDLHLGNMVRIDGKIVLFDCIEFNPMLRWIDVMSEIAFVFMDLVHLDYQGFAYRFLNKYLEHTGDYEGLALLRYYLVYRALVRAKVALLRQSQCANKEECNQAFLEYAAYADLTLSFTQIKPPQLMITHGFSGSGKSTFAGRLAENIGAIQMRSDVERKRLFGYAAQESSGSAVDNGIYSQDASERTYRHLGKLAKAVLDSGFSVIIDAAFLKTEQRNLFRHLAAESGVKFTVIDFQASGEMLRQRVEKRQNDPSEATVDVLSQQFQTAQPLTEEELNFTIAIDTEKENAFEILLDKINASL